MKTDFTFDNAANSQALDTQELELVSGGYFSSIMDGHPGPMASNVHWSPASLPQQGGRYARPNGWTYDVIK